jgi:hypothetical protein
MNQLAREKLNIGAFSEKLFFAYWRKVLSVGCGKSPAADIFIKWRLPRVESDRLAVSVAWELLFVTTVEPSITTVVP